ncbi:UNVERIFIED_CONTAM: hypothetical protein Sangu_2681100 [Sesamum angustifolium]|uniref:Uncharacterized protein n=1 Tax=Sesamum angustifolium TaxID=2727405 RepID=A0AAW2IZX0_9LAMI
MNFLNSLCSLTHTTYTGLLENPNPTDEAGDEDDRGNDETGGTMVESAGEDSDMGIVGKYSYTTSFNFNQFASLEEWVFDQGDVDSLALLEKLKDQWKWKFGDCMPHEEDIHRSTNPLHFVVERVATPFRGPPPQRLTWRQMFRCYQWGRWHRLLTPLTLLIRLGFHILVHRCFKNQLLQKCMVLLGFPQTIVLHKGVHVIIKKCLRKLLLRKNLINLFFMRTSACSLLGINSLEILHLTLKCD